MVSAIVVAAIPVTGVSADESDNDIAVQAVSYEDKTLIKVVNYTDASMTKYEPITTATQQPAPSDWQSKVPFVDPNVPIYTTGTSGNVNFQFAFVTPSSTAGDQVAVILGATINNLPNNSLTIPEQVDAYRKYTANTTSTGYCAVNRSDQFLYYMTESQKLDDNKMGLYMVDSYSPHGLQENEVNSARKVDYTIQEQNSTNTGEVIKNVKEYMEHQADDSYLYIVEKTWTETDAESNLVEMSDRQTYQTHKIMIKSMSTCDYDNQSPWINLGDDELYFWNGGDDNPVDLTQIDQFAKALEPNQQRIHDAKVQYIGRQYLTGANGVWKIAGVVDADVNPENGVFSGKGQIVNLTIGDNLLGIGDAAFYSCGGLKSVTLGNGLSTIGNSAFANCINLDSCNMQLYSEITAIGRNAFLNCRALKKITIPTSVKAIGDYCFKGCSALEEIELCGNGSNVQLNGIGYMAFQNCSSLSGITFPSSFYQDSDGLDSKYQKGIPIWYFDGCSSLQFIKVQNNELDITDELDVEAYQKTKTVDQHSKETDAINQFLNTVTDSFYFEGPSKIATYNDTDSPIHLTAKIHSASFKYLDEDKYEKVITCPESPSHSNTFIINSYGQLLEIRLVRLVLRCFPQTALSTNVSLRK